MAESTVGLWGAFTVANTLATVAGRDWSVPERFYPACCLALTATMTVLTLVSSRRQGLTSR